MKYQVSQGKWGELGKSAQGIRDVVFIEEQGISAESEHDERDAFLRHVVIFVSEVPVATGRLDEQGKIGRVAVLPAFRKKGFGKLVMTHLEAMAQDGGLKKVIVHAQSPVISFYEDLGYAVSGEAFFEANISHQRMSKVLK